MFNAEKIRYKAIVIFLALDPSLLCAKGLLWLFSISTELSGTERDGWSGNFQQKDANSISACCFVWWYGFYQEPVRGDIDNLVFRCFQRSWIWKRAWVDILCTKQVNNDGICRQEKLTMLSPGIKHRSPLFLVLNFLSSFVYLFIFSFKVTMAQGALNDM